jgi:hypothetical protein
MAMTIEDADGQTQPLRSQASSPAPALPDELALMSMPGSTFRFTVSLRGPGVPLRRCAMARQ